MDAETTNSAHPWKPRNGRAFTSAKEYLLATTGMTEKELLSPEKIPADKITNIPAAAELLTRCVAEKMPIVIVGDYDVDGITSSAILHELIVYMSGREPEVRIPRRISDGYGVNQRMVADIKDSLLICVDNGITAKEPLQCALDQGNLVLVLDHHLASEMPAANVVVDPHVTGGSAFDDYCGAGLALKLAEYIYPDPGLHRALFYTITALACIGTIADVMPLIGDNRRIVQQGLAIINNRAATSTFPWGLQALLNLVERPIVEETIGYSLGPIINAVGRLYDAGATSALKAILCRERIPADIYAHKMRQINDDRKEAVAKWTKEAPIDLSRRIQIIYFPQAPEGIMGIIAGKIAEQTGMPAIALTDAREPGILKGSARSAGGVDLYSAIDHAREYLIKAGGHAEAAGLSLYRENLIGFSTAMETYLRALPALDADDCQYYDLAITQGQARKTYQELRRYAPYGEGCPKPVVCLSGFACDMREGPIRYMGKEKQHLKLQGECVDAVAFGMSDRYNAMGQPMTLDLLGTLGENTFRGDTTIQFAVSDMRVQAGEHH